MTRLLVVALLGGCNLIFPKPEGPKQEPPKPLTRADVDQNLRAELAKVEGDACAKATWMTDRARKSEGLEAEVAEELKATQVIACRQLRGGGTLAPTTNKDPDPEPLVFEGECTKKIAETKLLDRGDKKVDKAAIEEAFAQCFNGRIKTCQTALDTEIDQGVTCWRKAAWPEVPASVEQAEVAATSACLGELQAVTADLKSCAGKKKQAERDACVTPYVGYVPKCGLIDAARAWKNLPTYADIERVANADTKKRADREAKIAKEKFEQEARIAKETARCNGKTTLDLATQLVSTPALTKVPGCRYQVTGNVLSKNNVYVQLADASGKIVYLMRTREELTNATIVGRTALFETVENAELSDGTTQKFAVFVLERK